MEVVALASGSTLATLFDGLSLISDWQRLSPKRALVYRDGSSIVSGRLARLVWKDSLCETQDQAYTSMRVSMYQFEKIPTGSDAEMMFHHFIT